MKTNCQFCAGAGCKLCRDQQTPVIFLPVVPMGAVRTTQKQKYKDPSYKKYANYKTEIGLLLKQRIRGTVGRYTAISLPSVTFYMPMPKNGKTSRKDAATGKRYQVDVSENMPHVSKPDADNLLKGLFDALNGVIWEDDAQVFEIGMVRKVYSESPGIEFSIETVGE
ncbi:holliday junction resolvase [Bacillus phage Silence]|nr:holliday junction resolvase [Bacillus phage Silence]